VAAAQENNPIISRAHCLRLILSSAWRSGAVCMTSSHYWFNLALRLIALMPKAGMLRWGIQLSSVPHKAL
jgi:hypothetical protein